MEKPKIFVVGMWHLGCVTSGCMNALEFPMVCFDFDKNIIDQLSNRILPIYEKGLYEHLFDGSIKFTNDISDAADADYIFITYDIGANGIELDIIDRIIKELKPYVKKQIIVVRSQVTIGICDKIKKELNCDVCCFPENLRLGTAVDNFYYPDWMVFGLSSKKISKKIDDLFKQIQSQKVYTGLKEAEMIKMSMNCYLATMISFSGEISNICEAYDINAKEVLSTLKLDQRVSKYAPILPGLGIGGGTILRDVRSVRKLGETIVLNAVYDFNEYRKTYVEDKLKSILGDLNGKTITFFGAAYKSGTNTLRESLTVKIIRNLLQESDDLKIKVFDPLISTGIDDVEFIKIEDAKNSDAIVIMNEWEGFKVVDYKKLKPKAIIDTKNILSESIPHYGVGVNYK